MNIYYAHPISDYGTERELNALVAIRKQWPDAYIVNPALLSEKVNAMKAEGTTSKQVMQFFLDIVENCDLLVFSAFKGGDIGAGVAQEILVAHLHGKPVWKISNGNRLWNTSTLNNPLSGQNVLTIEQTRSRVKQEKV